MSILRILRNSLRLLIFGCVAYKALTHHFMTDIELADSVRLRSFVFLRYCNTLLSFFQSSTSALAILEVRNPTANCVSGHALFVANRSLATILCNTSLCLSSSGFALSSTLNICSDAGVLALPLNSSGNSSIISLT
jgi:hypothetical protein